VAAAIDALGDPRVRLVNLTHRHAATDAERHWLVGSVPARNTGYALRFFGRELVAAWFGHPNDWFRVETMMRVGVRFGMVDEILYDYYPW
jgi:hypothetical protein